ncbi:vascular endothelial growth factor receptor 1-like isoform X3 [Astyanax mexicanus]|uniref:vascular endothelial growth factor receptor 1-like isoform X3 n=1 Tax=Astyanax mexicanus TaxID=7994 RepID=UPI0020CB1A88|nr:vascular endothelial growth factor receptor 1-like isoform X3 [Astyanax mexicanus]
MRVCVFCVLVVGLKLGVFEVYTLADNCPIRLSHDSLLVEYGNAVKVNCSLTTTLNEPYMLGWEAVIHPVEPVQDTTSTVWNVSSLTEWEINTKDIFCFLTVIGGTQCEKPLKLNLYKRADSVVIVRDNGDWSEGEQRKLKCEIKNVGPVSNLTVQWTRLDQNQTRTIRESRNFTISSRMEEKGDVTDTLEVWTSPEEDGVQYQCSALLDLIQFKQQQVDESQPFNITVLYKPIITRPSAATVSKTAGDALTFYCSARGKPKPQFTWTTGNSNITHSPLLNISNVQSEHQGNYTCIASNSKGSASVTVTVTVSVPSSEDNLPIIASCVAVAVALLIVGLFVWYCKHYRHTHMGRYILRNLASRRHNANVAHCDSQTLQSH